MSADAGRQRPFAFICYGHANQEYVTRLVTHLGDLGIDTWHDAEIPNGARWDQLLKLKIVACGGVIVVVSSASVQQQWVDKEIQKAQAEHKPIFPLLLDGDPHPLLTMVQHTKIPDDAMPDATWIRTLRAGLAQPPTARRHRPWRLLAVAGLATCLAVAGGATWVAREVPDAHRSALPAPPAQPKPSPSVNDCGGLPTRIEGVTEESPGRTGLRPTAYVRVCAAAAAGHEYWLMDYRLDREGAKGSRVFYVEVHVDGQVGSENGYQIEHGPLTEAGSQRWYVVVDVPPALTEEVRRSRDNDYGRQIGRDEKAPPTMAIVSNEMFARR